MKKTLLVMAILLGFLSRAYQFQERYLYDHDQDLASWIVKDIVVDRHIRLIGQLTSSPGIFIGPLFYYSLIPFYLIGNMDPLPTVAITWIFGVAGIISIYYVFRKLYNPFSGNVAALIYAVSFFLSGTDRRVVPTTPVMLWSIWFFYAINNLFSGNKRSLWILAILFALVWHINLALGLLFPIVLVGVFINRHRFKIRDFAWPVIVFLILSAPLIIFEARHNFQQTRALTATLGLLGLPQKTDFSLASKLDKTIRYSARNANNLFLGFEPPGAWLYLLPGVLAISLLTLNRQRSTSIIYASWIVLYIAFFSLHPINLSEYYLSGLDILSIAGLVYLANWLWHVSRGGVLVVLLILPIFFYRNLDLMLTYHNPRNGYIQRKAIVAEIKADAAKHDYPCVSVSYITDIGNDLGYRYLFYLSGLHVNPSSKLSPVYSIVFPQSRVDKLDLGIGSIGLIYPDYDRYNKQDVAKSCEGDDPNLTGSMFGFTK